jgi:hypothetical protein
MLVLSYHLPAVIRLQNWQLLFSLERDGYSHHTFFDKLNRNEETILVIQDRHGHNFGAFCTSIWESARGFTGDYNSWIFTFRKGEDLHLWPATGNNEMY